MALQQHLLDTQETIAAQASAVGGALRGIIRITGPKTFNLVKQIFVTEASHGLDETIIPLKHDGFLESKGLMNRLPVSLYWWPTGRSFTGQPLAELHLIGSPPLINHTLSEIYLRGARPATPGEFTLRAFLSGKLDLVQAEAVLGVIDARTDNELDLALSQLAGGISNQLKSLRSELLNDLADLEAGLDFVDEDIEFVSREALAARIKQGIKLAQDLMLVSSQRMISNSMPKVVLAGLPNAGKSTLFNILAEKSEAIVSPISGTTRDYLSAVISITGLKMELVDTAGVDESTIGVDQYGQTLGQGQIKDADVVIWCEASDLEPSELAMNNKHFNKLSDSEHKTIKVLTKLDLHKKDLHPSTIGISTLDLLGISTLKSIIHRKLTENLSEQSMIISSTAARCQDVLQKIIESLGRANSWLHSDYGDEMIALEIRSALESLGEITGEVYTNDLLDRIFSRFCIGK